MIKWDVVLDKRAFYNLRHSPRVIERDRGKIKEYQSLLEQHTIVLSSSLRDLYESYYYENSVDELDELETFFDDLASYSNSGVYEDGISYISIAPVIGDSVPDVLSKSAYSAILKNPIIVCDSSQDAKKVCSNAKTIPTLSLPEVVNKRFDNKIYRNSIVFSKDLYPDNGNEFKVWLAEAFHGEMSIDIIDPYFLTDRGLSIFSRFYIFNIEREAEVNIYTAQNEVMYKQNWENLVSKAQQRKIKIHIYRVNKYTNEFDFHERRIYFNTSRRHLAIGHGIDAIRERYDQGKQRIEMRDCHLTIDDDMDYRDFFLKNFDFIEIEKPID